MSKNMVLDYEGSWALLYADISFRAMKKYNLTCIGMTNSFSVSIGNNRYYRVYVEECDLRSNQDGAIAFFNDSVRVGQCIKDIKSVMVEMKAFERTCHHGSLLDKYVQYCDLCECYLLHYNTISSSKFYDKVWQYLNNIVPSPYYFVIDEIRNSILASDSESLLTYNEIHDWIQLCESYLSSRLCDEDIVAYVQRFASLNASSDKPEGLTPVGVRKKLGDVTPQQLRILKDRYRNVQTTSKHHEHWSFRTFRRISENDKDFAFIRNVSAFPNLRLSMRESYQSMKWCARHTFINAIVLRSYSASLSMNLQMMSASS